MPKRCSVAVAAVVSFARVVAPAPGSGHAPAPAAPAQPQIVVLATGGTIALAQRTADSAGYRNGVLSVDATLRARPALDRAATVRTEQIADIATRDVTDAAWLVEYEVPGDTALLAGGPGHRRPEAGHRIESVRVDGA